MILSYTCGGGEADDEFGGGEDGVPGDIADGEELRVVEDARSLAEVLAGGQLPHAIYKEIDR
jgi:hypothetical protein